MKALPLLLIGCAPHIDGGPAPVIQAQAQVQILEQLDAQSPNVYLQAIVRAGSAYDPIGQEGLAYLTARSMVEGGAGERTGDELRQAIFPTGNTFEVIADREVVSLRLRCHRDHSELCFALFGDVVTEPRFDQADVDRLRDEALYEVTEGILSDEEALGNEVFDNWLFEAHPYGHPAPGRSGTLPLLSANTAEAFYEKHYVRQAVFVGIAGAYDEEQRKGLAEQLDQLKGTLAPELPLQQPLPVEGRNLLAVKTGTPVAGFHFGHPVKVTRNDNDWAPLFLAMTAFGAHRQSFGRLFRILRGQRGLNYGDYAYIEPFVQRGYSSLPEQGTIRSQPYFSVWIRPTSIENSAFALKLGLLELERLVNHGLTQEEFDDTRAYLAGHLPLLAQDPGRRLSFALDGAASNTPNILESLPAQLDQLTLNQVNLALKAHLHPDDLKIVAVTSAPAELISDLIEERKTTIVYADVKPNEEQAARDEEVANWVIGLKDDANIVDAKGIFQ
ncbi:MAG: insulinase family protein [Proteobacteria bacterium]|jgi:zinc protease|nr:insulinase family protein [Pseudomonadota bacterium]